MNILVLGATGFVGKSIFFSLLSEHKVIMASRRRLEYFEDWRKVDFMEKNNWDELLTGIDLVINAIGIIKGDYYKVQTETPIELYNACKKRNLRVISISAIGAEKEYPFTDFLRSKKIADSHLINYENGKIIYPGIVIGNEGKSSHLFAFMAGLPFVPILSDDYLPLVHITQLT